MFQLLVHHVVEYGHHGVLVGCAYIFQLEGHHSIIEIAYRSIESSFLHVLRHHLNLIISAEFIHEGKHGVSCYRVYQQVHVWQRKFISWAGSIEISKIYTTSYLPILLLYWHDVGQQAWMLDGLDETCGQQLLHLFYYLLFYFSVEHSGRLGH